MSRSSREEQIARTVYVGSIDRGLSAADVVDFFSVCGPIAFVRLDGDSYRGNRSAFIEFLSHNSAQAAIRLTGRTLANLPVKVAPSENTIQRPYIELSHDEQDRLDTALRHIKRRIRKWEKSENPDDDRRKEKKKKRRRHRSHDSGSDYSSEEEREKKRRRRKHRTEEELDEIFYSDPRKFTAEKNMKLNQQIFLKELQQKQITLLPFTLPPNYVIDVVSSAEKVDTWLQDNLKSDTKLVGMDALWDCTEGDRAYPAVITIATERCCLLYQAYSKHLSFQFVELLIDSKIKKIWCEMTDKVDKLRRLLERRLEDDKIVSECSLELRTPKSHLDVDNFVAMDSKGLSRICGYHLGQHINEDISIMSSRWSALELNDGQKRFAAEHAYAPLIAFRKITHE